MQTTNKYGYNSCLNPHAPKPGAYIGPEAGGLVPRVESPVPIEAAWFVEPFQGGRQAQCEDLFALGRGLGRDLGDTIAVCQLAIHLGRAIGSSQYGSAKEYQALRKDLDGFVKVLLQVRPFYHSLVNTRRHVTSNS
jgi:hypothetical protein